MANSNSGRKCSLPVIVLALRLRNLAISIECIYLLVQECRGVEQLYYSLLSFIFTEYYIYTLYYLDFLATTPLSGGSPSSPFLANFARY